MSHSDASHRPVEKVFFRTLDGLRLCGNLYPAAKRGPAVIINPGMGCVKEMFVPEVAEYLQRAGITAFAYDPRNLGESEGSPRNDIDPLKQISDYSDALTFLKSNPIVDSGQIVFWGQSFAGTAALCAAALDHRAKAVVAVCPNLKFDRDWNKYKIALAKSMQDRESQLAGNDPYYLPVLDINHERPGGMSNGIKSSEADYMRRLKELGAVNYENRVTIQSYYKIITWSPLSMIARLESTPSLIIVPELDTLSPAEEQIAMVESLRGPKKMYIAPGRNHMDILSGDGFDALCQVQRDFVLESTCERESS
ncbi:Thiohydrolase [Fulvia fulva]|uniref:Thiohydrolase n=1 Tax=Passalora fulva TaxID=5499 RepID=A0A9Q8USZ8_PASFU|nr:Thiohydrolase [Fulvia fulva]KAK4619260.1 Thiohydrolase [Fulvia fulva]UJO21308.1 Thiohydrolase [Fulvia fulva]